MSHSIDERGARSGGFALIDVVVALTIAGLIFVAIASLFNIVTRASVRADAQGPAFQAHITRNKLEQMFAGAVLMPHLAAGCAGLTGDGEQMSFVTSAAPLAFAGGLAEVQLSREQTSEGTAIWLRLRPISYGPQPGPPPSWEAVPGRALLSAPDIDFVYHPQSQGRPAPPRRLWTNPCAVPGAVDLILRGSPDQSMPVFTFPLRVQKSTNFR